MKFIDKNIHDRRYFNHVPDYFTHRIEPLIVRHFVDPEVCRELIEQNRNMARKTTEAPGAHSDFVPGTNTRPSYRNNDSVVRSDLSAIADRFNPTVLGRYINEWWALQQEWDWIPELPKPLYTTFIKDQYCRNHQDVVWGANGVLERKTRRASVILYLNDWSPIPKDGCFTGGDLLFSSVQDEHGQCLSLKPRAGDLVAFPSNSNYYHSVQRVTSGERHNIVHWLRFKE